jgi:hypothetical protein
MKSKALAELALKIWGIIVLANALVLLPTALALATSVALDRASQIGYILNFVVHALVGGALILWSGRLVEWVIPESPPLQIDADATELHVLERADERGVRIRRDHVVLGFALVGVFLLVEGLANVAGAAYTLSRHSRSDNTWSYFWDRNSEAIVKSVVQLAAGLVLLAGSNAIGRGWLRLRGRAAEKLEDNNFDE